MRLELFVLTEFALSMLVIVEIKMPRGWIFSGMEHDVWSCSFLCTDPCRETQIAFTYSSVSSYTFVCRYMEKAKGNAERIIPNSYDFINIMVLLIEKGEKKCITTNLF